MWKLIASIFIAALVFLWLIKAPIMSWVLTDKLKVPVEVGSVSIWPSITTINRFKIENPRGFKIKTAFEAKKTTIEYEFHQLFADPSEIQRIEIDDIFLGIDCSNPACSENNWTAIGSRFEQKEETAKPREVVVHKLILSNLKVEIRGLGLSGAPQHKQIDRLEFDEISSETGFPTDKLIRAIFQGAGIQDFLKNAFAPQNALRKLLPIFGDAEEEK